MSPGDRNAERGVRDPEPGAAGRSSAEEIEEARRLLDRWGDNATCYQILNPGIERVFLREPRAVVGYRDAVGYRVMAGDPVCAPDDLARVVDRLETTTPLAVCWFAASERLARLLAARGPYDRILLGAQPVWDPVGWPDIVATKASLRAQLHRARNKGVGVREWSTERAFRNPELQRCRREWLAGKGLPPMHFLVETETLGRLEGRRVFVAEIAGRPVGFLVASPIPLRGGWLVEQVVRGSQAPNGTSESLVDRAFRDLAASGARWTTLGLSPLSSRLGPPGSTSAGGVLHSWWLRALLGWVRAHGTRFYNFRGLDRWKAKLQPDRWEPVSAITTRRRFGPKTLWAIAEVFGGESPPVFVGRAVVKALRQEWAWLVGRAVGRRR